METGERKEKAPRVFVFTVSRNLSLKLSKHILIPFSNGQFRHFLLERAKGKGKEKGIWGKQGSTMNYFLAASAAKRRSKKKK